MFGNCFSSLFSVYKNNFLFLRLKILFGDPKWTKNKNYSQNSICEENSVFSFQKSMKKRI